MAEYADGSASLLNAIPKVAKIHVFLVLLVGCVVGQSQGLTCGTPQISPRSDVSKVKGGTAAVPGSWPWQIRLGIRYSSGSIGWMCGGSILTEKYVITAAHCLTGGTGARYVVRVGDHDQQRQETSQSDYEVLRFRIHPSYGGTKNFFADIAILRLSTNIKFRKEVAAVCLPKNREELPHGASCIVTGWGQTGPSYMDYSPLLQQGKVQVIGKEVCNSGSYWGSTVISSAQICASGPSGIADACKGDSGGPLVAQDPLTKNWVLHGIVSFGPLQGCGNKGKPAVYTKVSNFITWIEETTGYTV